MLVGGVGCWQCCGEVPCTFSSSTTSVGFEESHQSPPEPAPHHAVDDKVDARVKDQAKIVEASEDPHEVGKVEAPSRLAEPVVSASHPTGRRGVDNGINLKVWTKLVIRQGTN